MPEKILDCKVAVVTGGGNGIGAAIVRMLAEKGASVVVGYKTGDDCAMACITHLKRTTDARIITGGGRFLA